jgi:VCBS repeat protein/subtilase family protein
MARIAVVVTVVSLAVAGAAWAAFPQDPPNDPEFAPAEAPPAATTCLTKTGDNQEHYLFSEIPQCTPNAQDPEGSAGMFIDRAWRDFTTGKGATVAYIEGGINWHGGDSAELANRVFLNSGELPPPTTPSQGTNACGPGVLCAADYVDTPDSNGNGIVDPEDIIVYFSNGVDNDQNGYTDDISGWDFYNDQNDPATLDSTYNHANGQMKQAAAETNNQLEGAGVCPDCRLLPVKAGAEALDRTDDLAQAWLYATDLHADVIVSTTADLGYSTFMSQAVDYAWKHGTAMVESSNDFDSTDHQGGMFHQHVLPGNGMVANTHGLESIPDTAVLQNNSTTTYRARSGYTSWGTHNVFTAATTGGTTSESTPTVGGVLALVLAYGKQAAAEHKTSGPLTPDEAVQVLRATASDVAAPVPAPVNWPAKPGFDLQYGYGRPNVYKAMQAVSQNNIPPEAWIDKPAWYALFDPTTRQTVDVTGHVAARRSSGASWTLKFAPGAEPNDSDFITAGQGQLAPNQHVFDGTLGTIDLSQIPASFWNKAYTLSQRKELETSEAYTVTIRLRVFDANGRMGEERRSIAVHHDPTLRSGFPREIGPGGESQPTLADLQGTGSEAIIFGDSDGRVHALDGHGSELTSFPVFTNRTVVTKGHAGVNAGHEPLFTNLAVGDLDHNGKQWIVGTSSTGRVYVWDSHGHRRPGWPKTLDTGVSKPPIPRPASPFTRPPIMGATAPPVLADLDGNGTLEIIQAGWDGRLHAWRANGQNQPGWPVEVTLPPGTDPPSGNVLVNDHKLDLPPALAQLDSDPQPELVQRTQYSFTPGAGLQVGNAGRSNIVAYNSDGSRVPNWLISSPALAFYYGSAQEFITEGVSDPVTADVTGDGKSEIAFAPGIFSPTELHNPDGSLRTVYGPNPVISFVGAIGSLEAIQQTLQGNVSSDIPVNFTTSGAFGNFGGGLAYAEPGSGAGTVAGALLLPGSGLPINSYARAFGASTGSPLAGFPAKLQGLDFLGAPAIADVNGDGQPELLIGADSSALHAYSATTGGQASGFPKFMTGWEVFGPTVGDINGDGTNEVAITTREGYVMVWNTRGRASGNQWWSSRHDQHNTGQYGVDAQSPGVARNARIESGQLRFRAPGDDWYVGKLDHYTMRFLHPGGEVDQKSIDPSAEAGKVQKVNLPANTKTVRVRAVDEAGNRGRWVAVQR